MSRHARCTRSGNDNSWLKRMLHISFLLNSDQKSREIKIRDSKRNHLTAKGEYGHQVSSGFVFKSGTWDSESFLTTNPMLFGTTLVVISSLKTEEICGCS